MNAKVIRRADQADGQFNGGAVLEKRPVFYQQEKTFPYSNLFYWAHAWSDQGSTIGLHPHQGFEILSFVLKGEIEHFDTKNKSWLRLKAGDAQIIRSGSGISHAEKLLPGSAIFQIWFDPDLQATLQKTATYNDYFSDTFPLIRENGYTTKVFKGENAPIEMDTEGIAIKQITFSPGNHILTLSARSVYSFFVIEGAVILAGNQLEKGDFIRIDGTDEVKVEVDEGCDVFIIESPVHPTYATYIQG